MPRTRSLLALIAPAALVVVGGLPFAVPSAAPAQADDRAAPTLDRLEPLVDTAWRGTTGPEGAASTFEVRFVRGLGERFVREHLRITPPDGERVDYVSVYFADPAGGVGFHSFGSAGDHFTGTLASGDDARAIVAVAALPGPMTVRRTLRREGDRLTWTADRWTAGDGGEGGDWSRLYEAVLAPDRDAAPEPDPGAPAHGGDLAPALAALAGFVGEWSIDATWSWGERLRARNVYRPVLGGAWLACDTWARDGDGDAYQRYVTWFGRPATANGPGDWTCVGFTYDGTVSQVGVEVAGGDGDAPAEVRSTIGPIRQRVALAVDGRSYRWRVTGPAPDDPEERMTMMDDVWRRVNAGGRAARPIDPGLFVAAGADVRAIEARTSVAAPPDAVFGSWASAEGVKSFMGIDANVELAVGGPYEWIFLPDAPDGSRGGEGCQVLSWAPGSMISFTWNAPPTQPISRGRRTWVVVRFDARDDGGTDVVLEHLGFGEGGHWDETRAYFERAWPSVLSRLADHHGEVEAPAGEGG